MDSQEENKEIDENSSKSISVEEMDLETPDELQATGEKKLINKLLKNKIIMIEIVCAIVFFGLIIILVLFSEGTGTNDIPYYESTNKCENVKVVYEPFGEKESSKEYIPLESYVKGAMFAYLDDLTELPENSFQYYYALAIAIRTEAISRDCTVTYYDKEIVTNNSINNSSIERALRLSQGLILTNHEKEIIPVRLSSFCWTENENNQYSLYQVSIPSEFVSSYYSNDIYSDCKCNYVTRIIKGTYENDECKPNKCYEIWDTNWKVSVDPVTGEEVKIPTECNLEWKHQEKENSYSVLGSLQLYLKYGHDHMNLFREFYGNDIQLMTINKNEVKDNVISDSKTNCSDFSITTTTLTKTEFMNRVQNFEYLSDSASQREQWNYLVSQASKVYDYSVAHGVNPELVYIRAYLEGLSPATLYPNYYNYWGIACYNNMPLSTCTSYKSIDEGIAGFVGVLNRYENFSKFSQRYAYLGDNWYNPGDSGKGGCYYAPYLSVKDDPYVQDACSEERKGHCVYGVDESMCLPTREVDRDAYGDYQGSNMKTMRKRIFGIESNTCSNNTLNYGKCTIFNQADSRWASDALGHSSVDTLGNAGCAVTSVAIAMTCTGLIDDDNFSPAILNEKIKEVEHGFDDSLIYWNNAALTSYIPSFHASDSVPISLLEKKEIKINKLKNAMGENKIPIVHLSRGHYVVMVGINEENNTITALDPSGGKENVIDINSIDGVRYYTF